MRRPTLNGDQRKELLYEGLLNYAIDNGMESPNEYANSNIGTYAYKPGMGYTDWRKELLRTAMHQSYEASVSGVLHSMLRSATTIRKDWPKTPAWTVTLRA